MNFGNKCGGRGICKFCGQTHDNISYHEAWGCDKNPAYLLPEPPSIIKSNGFEIYCNACHKQITSPAAILFSPPKETTRELMMVKKFHLCHACYGIIYDTLKLEISKYDPQRSPDTGP